jgi:ribonuclease T1
MVAADMLRKFRRASRTLLCMLALLFAGGLAMPAPAAALAPAEHSAVSATSLPREARETLRLIQLGGPFPYRKDGVVFGNREHQLPAQRRGYYHEYTVPTPNARNRGARRIITGGDGEYYYTDDHYQTFRRIQTR